MSSCDFSAKVGPGVTGVSKFAFSHNEALNAGSRVLLVVLVLVSIGDLSIMIAFFLSPVFFSELELIEVEMNELNCPV